MNIGLPKPADILKLATKLAGPALGGPIGAALNTVLNLGKSVGQMQSAFSKLRNSLQNNPMRPGAQTATKPQPFSVTNIHITIVQNPVAAAAQSPNQRFQMAPIVGNDSQWPGFSAAANSRITGNSNGLFDGTNPWAKNDGRTEERAAVGWVMQQNDSLRYDADQKTFYTTGADGSRTNKLSLDQAVSTIRAHGGASPTTGAAFQAVGKLANDAAHAAQPATPQQNPFQAITNIINQVVNMFQQLLGGQLGQAAAGLAGGAGMFSGSGMGLGPISSILPIQSPMTSAASSASSGGSVPSTSSGWGDSGSSSSSGSTSATGGGSGAGGGNLDSMMADAESMMKSGKMEDQLKAQKMMQQVMRTFELLSKMIEKQSEMASKAIAAIK